MSQTLDRTKAPEYKLIDKISFKEPKKYKFSNGIELFSLDTDVKDIVRIEFIFKAGNWYESSPLVANTCNSMLVEGTKKYNANKIADNIDFYGSFVETNVDNDNASVTIYTLNKFIKETLNIVEELLKESTFPVKEFETYIKNKKQKFIVKSNKVKVAAKNKFSEQLFGLSHPYGNPTKIDDFDNISKESVVKFFKDHYSSNNCQIIISGNVEEKNIKTIEDFFGGNDWANNSKVKEKIYKIQISKEKLFYEDKKDAVQSAIRIGKVLFNKTHKDFIDLQILNTVFGGYFGSRLMSNIREDKGYTYGIGSAVVSLKNSGYFFIATEVGVEFCQKTIDEVYYEMKKIKTKKIKSDELNLVKSYMLGSILKEADGPFSLAEMYKSVLKYDLTFDYFQTFIKKIKSITPERLLELANIYLSEEEMLQVVIGKL